MSQKLASFRPVLETLEERIVPYVLAGSQWANTAVSVSFMPDGTVTDNGSNSNLFATLNANFATAAWQREFARALATWASVTPLNFHFVSDDGSASGTSGLAQGDSRFGDIRLGAHTRTDSYVAYTYYPSSSTMGGDEFLNSGTTFHIGTYLDLYSVLLHESGHALGLAHSTLSTAVMYPTIMAVYTGLSADDIAGIQAVYGARKADAYDAAASNDTLATATVLSLNSSGAASVNADLTTIADTDYYRLTAPANTDGTLAVTLDAHNLSLLIPRLSVYDANGNLLGTADAGTTYGGTASVNLSGLTPGQTYYIRADGATSDVFHVGSYHLSMQFGGVTALPTLAINNVSLTEGNSGTKAFTFTVTLSSASTSPVTVQYASADGTATVANNDYVPTSGTLSFAPGQTQQTITVLVNGNTVVEPDETFYVKLSNPTNATLGVTQGTGTIQNDDVAPDRYEPNDTPAAATNFGNITSVSQSSLSLNTTSDVDYYCFTPTKSGTYTVTVTAIQGNGTLGMTVLSAQQTILGTGQSPSGTVNLTVNLTAGQRYYVMVSSPTGGIFVYSLAIAKSSGKPGGGAKSQPVSGAAASGDGTVALPFPLGLNRAEAVSAAAFAWGVLDAAPEADSEALPDGIPWLHASEDLAEHGYGGLMHSTLKNGDVLE